MSIGFPKSVESLFFIYPAVYCFYVFLSIQKNSRWGDAIKIWFSSRELALSYMTHVSFQGMQTAILSITGQELTGFICGLGFSNWQTVLAHG